jgi:hypothetical protein
VRVILDIAHTELYLNVRRGVQEEVDGLDLGPLRRFVAEAPGVDSFDEYIDVLGHTLIASHVANAAGLLGEALPYAEGDLDLDPLMRHLATRVDYLVTETLEPDNNRADFMRDAQARIQSALGR